LCKGGDLVKHVVLKPELRTPGGETVSIYCDGEWCGDLYLVYREGDVLTGTIQLDNAKVKEHDLNEVTEEIKTYVEHLNSALNVESSSVVMMYGDISSVVEMEAFDEEETDEGSFEMVDDEDDEVLYADGDEVFSGETIIDGDEDQSYHLSVVYRKGEHTKYHLHDDEHNTLGIVAVDEIGNDISGRVEFWVRPDEGEAEEVARSLVRTFADSETETISFTMNYEDQHIGDMHLERRDFL
jgi:hypothetical protein